jgi:hypothetical protein
MKNLLPILACVATVAPFGAGMLQAAPPPAATTGTVLVLENEHTLEGEIEQIGTQYRVRRSVGETWVPADRALRLCADAKGAYEFLRSRVNPDDADERLRLAYWCRQHSLPAQALDEVREAVRLRPGDAPSRNLLDHLLRAAEPVRTPPTPTATAVADKTVDRGPDVDLSADCLGQFATRVQPILMNTCAACHTAGKGGKFQLTRAYEFDAANRKTTRENLAAVLGQVNLSDPDGKGSPLLTKAVSVHGATAQAPLKDRRAPAYKVLEEWVKLTLANNPQLQERVPTPKPQPADASPTAAVPNMSQRLPVVPNKPTAPADAFDPAEFNRQTPPNTPAATPPK